MFRVDDAPDDLGDEADDVLVLHRVAGRVHRLGRGVLDLRLGVVHERVEDGDHLSQEENAVRMCE